MSGTDPWNLAEIREMAMKHYVGEAVKASFPERCKHNVPKDERWQCGMCLDDEVDELVRKEHSASDVQVGGDHYKKLAIQPMEYSMANKLDPLQHTAIKYVTRFRDKNGIEDLRKAIHCIEMLIEWEEKRG